MQLVEHDLIQTKLHRPPLPVDMVPRPRLTEFLDLNTLPTFVLISAPAGYGKSTLAKCLVKALNCPSAWIQLDEHDNDIVQYLSYFLSAIQLIHPKAVDETGVLIKTSPLPPLHVLTTSLINELNQIKEDYLLVLDDYQYIREVEIHHFVEQLLLHPPPNLHLVLSTRMDPLLPLARYRAHAKIVEFRAEDLRFTVEETQQLLQIMLGSSVDEATIKSIDEQTEGWVTGVRLAALAMRHRIGRDAFQGELSIQNRYVTEYLVKEILAKQAATLSDCMLKTSILDRFCADLCKAVCFHDAEPSDYSSAGSDLGGEQFLEWLQASNLFVIPLGDDDIWFRYHHLFQDFLKQELTRRLSSDEIAKLHVAAGSWYAQNGFIEEALYHLFAAGDTAAAIEVVAKNRYHMMNSTQWPRLERLLNLFPTRIVETSAELWMLKTWLVYHRGQFYELPALLQHLAAILAPKPNQQITNSMVGEISSLRSLLAYFAGDIKGAISQAREALDLLDPELWIVRVMARMYLSGSLLANGDASGSYHAFYSAFEEEKVQNKRFKATLLMTACNVFWVAADMDSMAAAAKQCIAFCQESDFREILSYGNYQLGRVYYQQNNLHAAEELFAGVVAKPYLNYGINYTNSACGLGFTYQALRKEAEARQVTEAAIAFLLETGNTSQLPFALTLRAELALMQERLPVASQWAEKLDPVPPLAPMYGFLAPHLTLVKVWLAQNTPVSLGKAAELLRRLQEYFSRTHNNRFLIDTLALQALLDQTLGNQPAALAGLEKALRLAQPGSFIRLFVDLGPQMLRALIQLKVDRDLHAYVKQILSAFPESRQVVGSLGQEEILDPLTNRELQILELLKERMTNKEIAAQLTISPGTIKGHTIRIYHKLDVKGRHQAVEKAITLGILPPR